jgi:hypothetical protein
MGMPPGPTGLQNRPVIDPGTNSAHEMPSPGGLVHRVQFRDELTPIARYIAAEMNTNAHGDDVKHMAEMNAFSPEQCITDYTHLPWWKQLLQLGITPEQCVKMGMSFHTAALLSWGLKVRQDGDWDHKPKIAKRFHPRSPGLQHWHLYGNTLYFYDVWSNIHYGYVGRAAGFSSDVLLDGAGLEQIGSDLATLNLPSRSPGVDGLRAWDGPSDRAAITMGIDLYRRHAHHITANEVLMAVITSPDIRTKPYSP